MKHSCRTRLVASSAVVVLGGLLAGCSTSLDAGVTTLDTPIVRGAARVPAVDGGQVDIGSLDQQVPAPASFREVVAMADTVVLGSVVHVGAGPKEGPIEYPEAQIATGRVTVDVSRVLAGDPTLTDGGTLFVAFGTGQPVRSGEALARLRSALPTSEMLWVLTSVERARPGQSVFVLANPATLVESVDGVARPVFFSATASDARRGSLSTEQAQSTLGPLVGDIARMDYDNAIEEASNALAREP